MINSHAQKSFSGIIPDNVKYITLDISSKLMHNRLVNLGIGNRDLIIIIWDKAQYDDMLQTARDFYVYGYSRENGI